MNIQNFKQLTQAEAVKMLKDKGYIKLKPGSYFTWIEKNWFERYRHVLSNNDGVWIPHMSRLNELSLLDQEYKSFHNKELGISLRQDEEMRELIKQESAEKKSPAETTESLF